MLPIVAAEFDVVASVAVRDVPSPAIPVCARGAARTNTFIGSELEHNTRVSVPPDEVVRGIGDTALPSRFAAARRTRPARITTRSVIRRVAQLIYVSRASNQITISENPYTTKQTREVHLVAVDQTARNSRDATRATATRWPGSGAPRSGSGGFGLTGRKISALHCGDRAPESRGTLQSSATPSCRVTENAASTIARPEPRSPQRPR